MFSIWMAGPCSDFHLSEFYAALSLHFIHKAELVYPSSVIVYSTHALIIISATLQPDGTIFCKYRQ
jgi:hypothetical protein